MRARVLVGVAALLVALLVPSGAPSHRELVLDVPAFADASDLEHELAEGEPVQAQPQTGTCGSCSTSAPLKYTFRSKALDSERDAKVEGPVKFRFWLRTAETVEGLPGIPPGYTNIYFQLSTSLGASLAEVTVAKNIQGMEPVLFEQTADSRGGIIPAGAHLVWNVTIQDVDGRWRREMAPYGVSLEYRFQIRLPIWWLQPVPRLEIRGPYGKTVSVGEDVSFSWRLWNDGEGAGNVTLRAWPDRPGSGVEWVRLEPNVTRLMMSRWSSHEGNLTSRMNQVGDWKLRLVATARTSGDVLRSSEIEFEVNVTQPPRGSGPASVTAGPISCGRGVSMRVELGPDRGSAFLCRWQDEPGPVDWTVRATGAGQARLTWRDGAGNALWAVDLGAEAEVVRLEAPRDGILDLFVHGEEFSGVVELEARGVGDGVGPGSARVDPGAAFSGLAVLALGVLAFLVFGALWRRPG